MARSRCENKLCQTNTVGSHVFGNVITADSLRADLDAGDDGEVVFINGNEYMLNIIYQRYKEAEMYTPKIKEESKPLHWEQVDRSLVSMFKGKETNGPDQD
jgi:hypothetical protein